MPSWVGTTKDCCGGFLLDRPQEGTMIRVISWIGLIAVVALIAGAFPLYAQQAGLTLESLAKRVDVLFAGQEYMTQRMTALETVVALSSEQVAVVVVTATPFPTATPVPTATLTPLPTPSFTPVPTSTPERTATATRRPSATPTLTPSITPTPTPASVNQTATRRLSLRRGPGNNHSFLAYVPLNNRFEVIGKNLDGSWAQVDYNGKIGWLPARYVEGLENVPIVATPTPLPKPTVTDTPTPVPTPTMEKLSDELWDRLKKAVEDDITDMGRNPEGFTEITKGNYTSGLYALLKQASRQCEMSNTEILDYVDGQVERIVASGKPEKYGFSPRYAMLLDLTESLKVSESTNCKALMLRFTSWVVHDYEPEESQEDDDD